MKKFLLILAVIVCVFKFAQHKIEQKRQLLTGKWIREQNVSGGWARMILSLKPEGTFLVTGDASVQGRTGFVQASGDWELQGGKALHLTIKNGSMPIAQKDRECGGPIIALDDKTLSYHSLSGDETWTRTN